VIYLRIQNAVSIAIALSVAILKNRSYTEITFNIAAKKQFGQLKSLSNAAISSQIGHILNPSFNFKNLWLFSMLLLILLETPWFG